MNCTPASKYIKYVVGSFSTAPNLKRKEEMHFLCLKASKYSFPEPNSVFVRFMYHLTIDL